MFYRYIDKVYDISGAVVALAGTQPKPQIPTSSIWLSAFTMFATRRKSLNAIETLLGISKRLDGLIAPDQLRAMLCNIDHQLGRNKALHNNWPMRIVAFDGHEFFSQ